MAHSFPLASSPLFWGLLVFVQLMLVAGLLRLFSRVNQWKIQVQNNHTGWLETLCQARRSAHSAHLSAQSLHEDMHATMRNAQNALPLALRVCLWVFLRQQPVKS